MSAAIMQGRVLAEAPLVKTYDDVLTPEETAHIISLAAGQTARAKVSLDHEYTVTDGRSGSNCWLRYDDDPVVRQVGERIAAMAGMPLTHAEAIQVVHYAEAQEYRPHFDAYNLDTSKGQRCCKYGGQRHATALVYLNQPEQGGGTAFPKLDIQVQAQPGRMVLFHNTGENSRVPHPDSLHAGLPVEKGEKWAFNIWFHARPMTEVQHFNTPPLTPPLTLKVNRASRILERALDGIRSDFEHLAPPVCVTYWDTYGNSHPDLRDLPPKIRLVSLIDRKVSNPLAIEDKLAGMISEAGLEHLASDDSSALIARIYLLIWNADVYLYHKGSIAAHQTPVDIGPALRHLVRDLHPILSDCVAATDKNHYLVLGLDTLCREDGRAQLVKISNAPNFFHNEEVNREVNIPFFQALMRTLIGKEDSRLERFT